MQHFCFCPHFSWAELKELRLFLCTQNAYFSQILFTNLSVWDALDRRVRQHVPVPANIQQLCTAIEEEWTNIPQATINNLINSMRRRCVSLCKAHGGHTRYWLVFGPPGHPNTVKLHILELPFIVASVRHTCAILMQSNQHLDMPHLWGG